MGRLFKPFASNPFVIALYYGEQKPKNLGFLTDFVMEYNSLRKSAVIFSGKTFNVEISAVICDAPARSFVKNVKGHSGYSGCERCIQTGEWRGKMTFPDMDAQLRSDDDFASMLDEDHHLGPSPLAGLGIGMISHFVLDYMHLVCLGIVRRLLLTWMQGPLSCRLGSRVVCSISEGLVDLKSHIPVEFCRKLRSLAEIKRWKATEFRTFLLYTGPIVLLRKLSDAMCNNFLLLHVALFILLSDELCSKYSEFAGELLKLFVQHCSDLYGKDMLVYKVHSLIHLVDNAKHFGALDNVSGFPSENFLGTLIQLVRKPGRPLQQVVLRLREREKRLTFMVGACKELKMKPKK